MFFGQNTKVKKEDQRFMKTLFGEGHSADGVGK